MDLDIRGFEHAEHLYSWKFLLERPFSMDFRLRAAVSPKEMPSLPFAP